MPVKNKARFAATLPLNVVYTCCIGIPFSITSLGTLTPVLFYPDLLCKAFGLKTLRDRAVEHFKQFRSGEPSEREIQELIDILEVDRWPV